MSSYGKACLQCTKAKVRCAYGNDRGPCERCTRLRKECLPAPRTRPTRNTPRADRQTALEAKVDSLVQLLRQNQALPDEGLSNRDVGARAQSKGCGPIVTSPLFNLTMQASTELQADNSSPESQALASSAAPSIPSSTTTPASAPGPELAPETDEELQDVLDTYREKLFQFFPVIVLGPEVTIDYMQSQRPFVWLILRAICSKSLARQLALARETKRVVAQRLVLDGERSFDMLAGLILYANWGQFFCTKANLSPCIQLAIGLAGDLGLTKPAPQTSPAVMLNWTPQGCPKPPHALVIRPRTMDERRTVLGLFLVSSITANFFQRSEPMRWTPYLNESLDIMMKTKEHSTDELLGFLIRVQLISNGIHADSWNDVYPVASGSQALPKTHTMYLPKMQLDELKRSIPANLQDNPVLQFHITGAEVGLHEHHLTPGPSPSITDQSRRVQGLWACFNSVKKYFELFFDMNTFPLFTYLYISMGVYTELGHCIVALFRLSTFESPDVPWDRQRIISELDLADVVSKWVHVFDTAPEAASIDFTGTEGQESQWDFCKKILLNTICRWWVSKVRPTIMDQPNEERDQTEQQQPSTSAGDFDISSMPAIDLGDIDFSLDNDQWMRDMMGSGIDFMGF